MAVSQPPDNFEINFFKSNILNQIKLQKRITTKEIEKNIKDCKNTSILRILNNNNYINTNAKITKIFNIKNLNKIINNNDNDKKLIKMHNITILNNLSFINILLNYDLIKTFINNEIPPSDCILDSDILHHVMNVENIIIFIDDSLTENIEELFYIIFHIFYHLNSYYNDSIKIKSKNVENLKYVLDYIKIYFDSNLSENYKNIIDMMKKRQIIDQNIENNLGGLKISHILKKENISYNKNMKNTINFLKHKFKKLKDGDDNDINIEYFKDLLEIIKEFCIFDDNSAEFSPPPLVHLQKLENIYIQRPSDNHDTLILIFEGDNIVSKRSISLNFFENAHEDLIYVVFEDLFGNNIKRNNLTFIILNKNDFKYKRDIFKKIYNGVKTMLSKTHNIDNIRIETEKESICYKFYTKINNKIVKRKIEEEEI